uniref:VP11 n=1 Tax=viral metagenome TaxID=1070528 RepID=A0A6C0AKC0_9ZZZZ
MGDSGATDIGNNVTWTIVLEDYFAQTGEKANGLAIMHKRAESIFTRRKTYIDLPVIVGSGAVAFLNAGSSSLFTDHQLAATALGVGSLVIGILNTVGTYFGWAKRAEGHRMSSIHYAKLYRFINVELRLPRDQRMQPGDFLKYVKDQYDRLAELSPLIPGSITSTFAKQMEKYKDISKPEETNGLNKINIFVDSAHELEGALSPLPPPPVLHTPPTKAATPSS